MVYLCLVLCSNVFLSVIFCFIFTVLSSPASLSLSSHPLYHCHCTLISCIIVTVLSSPTSLSLYSHPLYHCHCTLISCFIFTVLISCIIFTVLICIIVTVAHKSGDAEEAVELEIWWLSSGAEPASSLGSEGQENQCCSWVSQICQGRVSTLSIDQSLRNTGCN